MITEDYVSFETAKLLKEKGFNEDSWFHYDTDGGIVMRGYRLNMPEDIPAWTLQMTMKWLREVHKIFIDVDFDTIEFGDEPYYTIITDMSTCSYITGRPALGYNSYEDACETAIKYCLENLI